MWVVLGVFGAGGLLVDGLGILCLMGCWVLGFGV